MVIVADFTLECLVAVPDTSIAGAWLTRELNAPIGWRGALRLVVSDNPPELISQAMPHSARQCSVTLHCIGPG